MGKQRIYFISGLGADERIFRNLDFSSIEPVFIKWIAPATDETLASYAERLSSVIQESDPRIIGLSFGGMLAVETAKIRPESKVMIISSAKSKREIPYDYRLFGKIKIQNLLPMWIIKKPNFISRWYFGVKGSEMKTLFAEILRDTDSEFLKWAMYAIAAWKNKERPQNVFHIHGGLDNLLPVNYVHPDVVIKTGGHLMVLDHANRISEEMKRYFSL